MLLAAKKSIEMVKSLTVELGWGKFENAPTNHFGDFLEFGREYQMLYLIKSLPGNMSDSGRPTFFSILKWDKFGG